MSDANGNGDPPVTIDRGLVCRKCECRHFWVVYTRQHRGKIVRRRECRHCGERITTTERSTG